jgi:hypothetical protein
MRKPSLGLLEKGVVVVVEESAKKEERPTD